MRIAGVALALVGLVLLIPAMIVRSQLAVGDVNINTKSFRYGPIASALGRDCVVAGSTLTVRSFRGPRAMVRKS